MLEVFVTDAGVRLPEEREREFLGQVPKTAREAIGRFRRWEDRQATLFGRLLLRRALERITDRPATLLDRLEFSATAKPFIRGMPSFNISHSGGRVVLAVAEQGEVGVDIERIRPICLEDFSRYLPEVSEQEPTSGAAAFRGFFRCWTRKEAVLKGEGSGLLAPLDQVRLQGDTAFFRNQVWHLTEVDCGDGFCCHAAASEPVAACRVEVVNFIQEVQV